MCKGCDLNNMNNLEIINNLESWSINNSNCIRIVNKNRIKKIPYVKGDAKCKNIGLL